MDDADAEAVEDVIDDAEAEPATAPVLELTHLSDETVNRIAAAMMEMWTATANEDIRNRYPATALVSETAPGTSANVLPDVQLAWGTTVNVPQADDDNLSAEEIAPGTSLVRDTTVNVSRGAKVNAPQVRTNSLLKVNDNELTLAMVNAMLSKTNRTPLPDAPNFAGDKTMWILTVFWIPFKIVRN